MARIEVSFEVDVPADANYEDIAEWIRYQTGMTGGIKLANPLSDFELEADYKTLRISEV